LKQWGGKKGFVKRWRADPRNKDIKATEKEIIEAAKKVYPGVFE